MSKKKKSRNNNKKTNRKKAKKTKKARARSAALDLPFLEPEPPERWINKWTVESDLKAGPWFTMDDAGNVVDTHDAARAVLARAGDKGGEVWLWCLHCERFFQAKDLKLDFIGNWQRCPFDDCGAAGLDVDILVWDAYKSEDTSWPGSEDELHHGLCTRHCEQPA
jgi:hypothetical protein